MGDARWDAIERWMIDIRRRIHQDPELGLDTPRTAHLVEEALTELGLSPRRPIANGVVADLGTGDDVLLLRADMDALPIQEEENGLSYRSRRVERMHACGHDGHTAMLLGCARYLAECGPPSALRLRFMFQPGEEGPGGALPMIRTGVLADVRAAAMLHVHGELPVGTIGYRVGPAMAATNDFRIVVRGQGGHGAHPDRGVDAIYVAAAVVTAAQSLVSRETDPADAAVITFGTVRGGVRENVLADTVELTGTIRTLNEETRRFLLDRFEDLVGHTVRAHRATAEWTVEEGYPPLRTDPFWMRAVVESLCDPALGIRAVELPRPSLGGEDFAYISERVPGALLNVGVAPAGGATLLHHAGFLLDERALGVGARALAAVSQRAWTRWSAARRSSSDGTAVDRSPDAPPGSRQVPGFAGPPPASGDGSPGC